MTKTFGFSEDGDLVLVTGEGGVASNVTAPSLPLSIEGTINSLQWLQERALGVPAEILTMHPENWPWSGYGRGLDQVVIQHQKTMNTIQNGILDSMRVITDKYCPLTIRRQFRFPRSKKKRIRRKWTKNPRNWKDVRIAFVWVDPGSFFKIKYPDATERIQVKPGLEKRNAIIYGGF